MKTIKRGEIYWVNLPKIPGSHVQADMHPCCVVSNDICNRYSPVLSICPLSSSNRKKRLKTHVTVNNDSLEKTSIVLGEQVISIDRKLIKNYIGSLTKKELKSVTEAIKLQLQIK